jgi:hypothetical protein
MEAVCYSETLTSTCPYVVTNQKTNSDNFTADRTPDLTVKSKSVPLHAMEALGGRGVIAPTHS